MSYLGNSIKSVRSLIFGDPQKDKNDIKNVNKSRGIAQLQRYRVDVNFWRDAIVELERPYLPYRVKAQSVFKDTQLNGHVAACMSKRIDMTALRDFKVCNANGDTDDVWTAYFKKTWFSDLIRYIIEAEFFGYSLIALGDLVNDSFPGLTICARECTSPDRMAFSKFPYIPTGLNFTEPPYDKWHIWVTTPSDNGITPCGIGLLYKVAFYEILIRNNIGNNANYNQLFGMPIRWVKTTKTNEDEVRELQNYLESMAAQSYLITDMTEELQLVQAQTGGKGSDVYGSLEKRCEAVISKIILGHANAMDEQSGKLGAGQGDDNPVKQALEEKQVRDGRMSEAVINEQLLPKLRAIGINIPMELHFEFNNDGEKEEFRRREDESNKVTAEIFQTIKNAGGKPDWKYFTDRTGIPVEEAPPEPAPMMPKQQFGDKIQNKLKQIYNHKH